MLSSLSPVSICITRMASVTLTLRFFALSFLSNSRMILSATLAFNVLRPLFPPPLRAVLVFPSPSGVLIHFPPMSPASLFPAVPQERFALCPNITTSASAGLSFSDANYMKINIL